ncbi:MAG: PEGA domain-containing protein [Bacteroidales bacterium]|nr:PEGA domain-containing protein [Bacteroidales bacterium]
MKKLLLLLFAISLSIISLAQNTSPLKTVNFHKIPNDIVDLKALKDAVGRDTDLDGNKAALIIVKTQGFNQKALLDFNYYTRGIEMIHHKIENGELWWYVGSNSNGSIIIKYMGEYEFKIPQKLEAKSVYELILGMETATLVINAVPTNAEIFIDNEKVGTGYASKAVSIGTEHLYKVQCNNYRPSEDVVYFEKREKKELNVSLEPNFS